jgi:signal transduction histidine kinase
VLDFAKQIEMTARRGGLGLAASQFVGAGEHPALFVPMAYRGRIVGVLNVIGRVSKDEPFSDSEEELIMSFATSAATAVATAQSVESERVRLSLRAMEDERARWARELHDETLQGLGALRILLSSARRTEGRSELDAALERAIAQVTDEIANLRALITDLRPAALDELGLQSALEALIDQRRAQGSLKIEAAVDLAWDGEDAPARLEPELEAAIYRLVQEALTNAIKHADPSSLRIEVIERDGCVFAAVRDDGHGFDPSASHGGFGLTSMQERVSLADGKLEISSDQDGTTVQARFPVKRLAPPGDLAVG